MTKIRKTLADFSPVEIAEAERLIAKKAELNARFDKTGIIEPVTRTQEEIALESEYVQAINNAKLKNINN